VQAKGCERQQLRNTRPNLSRFKRPIPFSLGGRGDFAYVTRNRGSSASLIELALIIVLIAIVVMAILLIVGDDLRLWVVNTLQGLIPTR
jgi:Flp pilus assembly pilin Flp